MSPTMLASPDSYERLKRLNATGIRIDALARLYKRRDTVDALIECLEEYARSAATRPAYINDFIAARKCS